MGRVSKADYHLSPTLAVTMITWQLYSRQKRQCRVRHLYAAVHQGWGPRGQLSSTSWTTWGQKKSWAWHSVSLSVNTPTAAILIWF